MGREKPQALDKMIKKLFKFLESESVTTEEKQKYILDSNCLRVEVWNDRGIFFHDEKTPSGFTFGQVLAQCCKGEGPEFALWLCKSAYSQNRRLFSDFWTASHTHRMEMNAEDALALAREHKQEDLVKFLSMPWWSNEGFELKYKPQRDVILSSIRVEDEHFGWVKAFFDRAIILEQLPSEFYRMANQIMSQGCHPDELRRVLEARDQAKTLALAEGWFDIDSDHDFMENVIFPTGYGKEHPVLQILPYMSVWNLGKVHNYLTIEHHTSLLEYCLHNLGGWDAGKEIDVVQIAAYYNHADILEMFVLNPKFDGFLTDHATRYVFGIDAYALTMRP